MAMDLLLFLSVFAISAIVFVPLHLIAVRANGGRKLLSTINAMICLSALAGGAIGWLLLGDLFSSAGSRAVGCFGGGFSFLGFGGVYNLLGPASADRSISAHIVGLIYQAPGHRMSREELFALYSHADILDKRFIEFAAVGVIDPQASQLTLTAKGRRIALAFAVLGKALGLRPWYLARVRTRSA
jgi:hypothetical protein